MVGNHDDRGHLRRFFPDTPVDEDGHLQSVIDTPVGRLVLLGGTLLLASRLLGRRMAELFRL